MECRADRLWFCMYSQLDATEVLEGYIHVWSAPHLEEAYSSPRKYTVTSKALVLPLPVCQRWEI